MKPLRKFTGIGAGVKPKVPKSSLAVRELIAARERKRMPVPGLVPLEKAPVGVQIGAVSLALSAAQEKLVRTYKFPSRVAETNPHVRSLIGASSNISQALSLLSESERRRLSADESRRLAELRARISKEKNLHRELGIEERYIRILLK